MAIQAIVTIVIKKEVKLPSKYKLFKIVFKPDNLLLKHKKYNYVIPLKKGKSSQV